LTRDTVARLHAHGIQSLGLALDGSTSERHDGIRGIDGCFDATLRGARLAAEFDLPIQVNTLVSEETADDLPATFELLKSLRVMLSSLQSGEARCCNLFRRSGARTS
jgi:MoaA/NifB/PqqE/SkfB family radical SAM enzyme